MRAGRLDSAFALVARAKEIAGRIMRTDVVRRLERNWRLLTEGRKESVTE